MINMPTARVSGPVLPTIFFFVLLVVLIIFYFFGTFGNIFSKTLSGTLYLGLAESGSFTSRLYQYNIKSKQLEALQEPTFGANSASVAPRGEELVFVGWEETKNAQLYIIDKTTGGFDQLTTDALRRKRTPQWSPDASRVAFTATESDSPDGVKDWGVYVSDLDGKVMKIAPGMYPLWLSPNRGLYLGEDGVYAFDIQNKAIGKVLPLEGGTATQSMRVAISPDLKHFAWSVPGRGIIYVYDITSLDPLVLEKSKEITSSSFWVVFSPNGKYLAAKEVDWDTLETAPNPGIVAFGLKDNSRTELLDLSAYNQQAMFLSDWR